MFRRHIILVAVVVAAACDVPSSTEPRGPDAGAAAVADKQGTTSSQILLSMPVDDRNQGLQQEIFRMNADGTGVTQLTFPQSPGLDQQPIAFGKQIAFTRLSPTGLPSIHVMNADGTGMTQFPQTAGGTNPAPSPKGGRIALSLANDIYLLD